MLEWWSGWLSLHPLVARLFTIAVGGVLVLTITGVAAVTAWAVLYVARAMINGRDFVRRPLPELQRAKVPGLDIALRAWQRETLAFQQTKVGLTDLQRFAEGLQAAILAVADKVERLEKRGP